MALINTMYKYFRSWLGIKLWQHELKGGNTATNQDFDIVFEAFARFFSVWTLGVDQIVYERLGGIELNRIE